MIFKSAIVTQVSGSIGGVTAGNGKSNMYMRARSIPVNRRTQTQAAQRGRLAQIAELWTSTLTDAQRAAWQTYASQVPVTNRRGDPVIIGGQQHFCRSLQAADLTQLGLTNLDAPSDYLLPTATTPTSFTVDPDVSGSLLTFDVTDAWANEPDAAMIVFASSTYNAGRLARPSAHRFWFAIQGASPFPPSSPKALPWNRGGSNGQNVSCYVRILRADLRLSNPIWVPGFVTTS